MSVGDLSIGEVFVGKMSVGETSVGEVSVWDVSGYRNLYCTIIIQTELFCLFEAEHIRSILFSFGQIEPQFLINVILTRKKCVF